METIFYECVFGDLERFRQLVQERIANGESLCDIINSKDTRIGDNPSLLHCAITCDRLDIVKELLHHGVDSNIKDDRSITPLHCSVTNGYIDITTELLSSPNIDINVQDSYGKTPLHCAIPKYNYEMVELLLEHGCDPCICDKFKQTPKTSAMTFLKFFDKTKYSDTVDELRRIIHILQVYEDISDIKDPDQ
jgi:ankyrin repeat protein